MYYSMLNYLYSFGYVFLLNYYLKHRYPDEYNRLMFCVFHKVIYMVSYMEIQYNQLLVYFDDKFTDNTIISNIFVNNAFINKIHDSMHDYDSDDDSSNTDGDVNFVSDGIVKYTAIKENIINGKITKESIAIDYDFDYDFVVYSHYDDSKKIINKIIINDFPLEKDFNYTVSSIKFMLCEIEIGDLKIKIDFSTDRYNFYITNNEFDSKFITFFLREYYYEEVEEYLSKCFPKLEDYKLTILDHTITSVSLTKHTILKIKEDSYEIVECGNM